MTAGRDAARTFAHALMALIFVTIAAVCVVFGQDIEAHLRPVVGETAPTDGIYRDPEKVCWTLHLEKNAPGEPLGYPYYAKPALIKQLTLSPYLSDGQHRKYAQDPVNHPLGSRWTRTWCAELPSQIADNQSFVVSGNAEHLVHPGWHSLSYFKDFKVCGLKADDPPTDVPIRVDTYCDEQRRGFSMVP